MNDAAAAGGYPEWLPCLDGRRATADQPSTRDVPVPILTSKELTAEDEAALDGGVTGVLKRRLRRRLRRRGRAAGPVQPDHPAVGSREGDGARRSNSAPG